MEGEGMTIPSLQEALHNPRVSKQATEAAREAAVTARQEASATVTRLNERVQLEVAKAAGANVDLKAK